MTQRKPVMSRINATDARQFFGNVIKRAYTGGEHLIVEKNDLPVVVIVPIADYEEMRQALAMQNLKELGQALNHQIRTQDLTPEQVEEQIEETKRKIYQARYG
jgi:prevent-host-death family protein